MFFHLCWGWDGGEGSFIGFKWGFGGTRKRAKPENFDAESGRDRRRMEAQDLPSSQSHRDRAVRGPSCYCAARDLERHRDLRRCGEERKSTNRGLASDEQRWIFLRR